MSFNGFLGYKPINIDPNNPGMVDIGSMQEDLEKQQAIAKALRLNMDHGTTRIPRGTAMAGILANALSGYMQGKNLADSKSLKEADTAIADAQYDKYSNIDVDALRQQAIEKFAMPEQKFVHNRSQDVGPQLPVENFGTAATEQRGFNPLDANVGTQATEDRGFTPWLPGGAGAGRGNVNPPLVDPTQPPPQAPKAGVQSALNLGPVNPATAARMAQTQASPLARARSAQAPVQPPAQAPVLPPQQAPQTQYAENRVLPPEDVLRAIAADPDEIAAVDQNRAKFLRSAVSAQKGEALKALRKGGAESRGLYKALMAQEADNRKRMADREDKLFEWGNKPMEVGDGKSIVVPGTGKVLVAGGDSVAAQRLAFDKDQAAAKASKDAAEKKAQATQGLAQTNRAIADIDDVLGTDAPEKATGLSGLLGSAAAKVGFDNRWNDSRKQIDGLTSQAIQGLIADITAAGGSATQLMNTQVEAMRGAAARLNADAGTMSPEMLRKEIMKFRELAASSRNRLIEIAGQQQQASGGNAKFSWRR